MSIGIGIGVPLDPQPGLEMGLAPGFSAGPGFEDGLLFENGVDFLKFENDTDFLLLE